MALATSLRKTASKLMAKFGTLATLRRIVPGVYNPEIGTVSQTDTDYSIKGVFEEVRQNQVNDLIKATDRRFTIAAADISVVPTTADRLIYNGVQLEIILVNRTEQEGQDIIYELITRE